LRAGNSKSAAAAIDIQLAKSSEIKMLGARSRGRDIMSNSWLFAR
jgi:hypothetical protein